MDLPLYLVIVLCLFGVLALLLLAQTGNLVSFRSGSKTKKLWIYCILYLALLFSSVIYAILLSTQDTEGVLTSGNPQYILIGGLCMTLLVTYGVMRRALASIGKKLSQQSTSADILTNGNSSQSSSPESRTLVISIFFIAVAEIPAIVVLSYALQLIG